MILASPYILTDNLIIVVVSLNARYPSRRTIVFKGDRWAVEAIATGDRSLSAKARYQAAESNSSPSSHENDCFKRTALAQSAWEGYRRACAPSQ